MSVLVVLGVVWAAVLIPPVLRARAERRTEFIDSFQAQMGALGGKALAGRASQAPAEPHRSRPRRPVSVKQRRRDILGGLLGALIGSLVLGLIPSLRIVLVLHLFLLNLFIAYVALLAHARRGQAHRAPTWSPATSHVSVARRPAVRKPAARPNAVTALAPALHSTAGTRR
jgi:predicted lipid-binding transport protein (Tim44 family)